MNKIWTKDIRIALNIHIFRKKNNELDKKMGNATISAVVQCCCAKRCRCTGGVPVDVGLSGVYQFTLMYQLTFVYQWCTSRRRFIRGVPVDFCVPVVYQLMLVSQWCTSQCWCTDGLTVDVGLPVVYQSMLMYQSTFVYQWCTSRR